MSDAPKLVPLIDLLRRVPQSAVYQWTDADGLRASHTSPVGRYCHEAADRIAALEAENARLRAMQPRLRSALGRYAQEFGGLHDDPACPQDDTCECTFVREVEGLLSG